MKQVWKTGTGILAVNTHARHHGPKFRGVKRLSLRVRENVPMRVRVMLDNSLLRLSPSKAYATV